VGVLVALHRTSSEAEILEDLRTAAAYRSKPVVGVDVQGVGPLPRERIAFLARAAAAHALALRVHAGELAGADEVAAVIEQPSIRRLAHGVRAAEDPNVVRRLREQGVMLDVCITSNCALGLYPSIAQHPVRALFERGVAICLGTDDPLYFQTDITREYELARRVFGFSAAELLQLTRRGIERSFAAPPLKQSLLRSIDAHALAERACASTTG
jgi:adenosine deaminase